MTRLALRQRNDTQEPEPVTLSAEQLLEFNKGEVFLLNRVMAEGIAEPGEVPEWIQLTPNKGKFEGRDGRIFNVKAPNKLVREFNKSAEHIQLDIDHESEFFFGSTVASGWITKMAVRNSGEIWGQTEFTPDGAQLVIDRNYRGVSPVFQITKESFLARLEDPDVPMEVEAIVSAALTNRPNLRLKSLNTKEGSTMKREELIKLLGLNAEATDDEITVALKAAVEKEPEPAAPALPPPNASEMVPRADYELLKTQHTTLTAANTKRDKDLFEAECRATVDAAVEAGKVAPASKEYHLNVALSGAEALKAFKEFIGAAPEIAGDKQMTDAEKNAAAGGSAEALNSEERLVCKKLNLTAEEYRAAQKSIREDEETYHPIPYAFVH